VDKADLCTAAKTLTSGAMAYSDNWLRHLMAPFTGEGLSNTLARDFWRSDEDLWSVEQPVDLRWLKLVWVYTASVVSQGTFAMLIIGAIICLFKDVPLIWWLISVGGVTVAMLLFAVLVATSTYVDIWRARRRSGRQ
jgi:hypothetical protein